jgi:hypothetical protein
MNVLWSVLLACALALTAIGVLGLVCLPHGAWCMVLAVGTAGVAMVALGVNDHAKERL